MNYENHLLQVLRELQTELKANWTNTSPVEKFVGKHIDMLSSWADEEFYCIYKQMPGDWSKSTLAAEIHNGNFVRIIANHKLLRNIYETN